MPVFDFSNDTSEIKEEVVCTYTTFFFECRSCYDRMPYLNFYQTRRSSGKHHSCGVIF